MIELKPVKKTNYVFEPGDCVCGYCGWKPEDVWDDSPEGFKRIDGVWTCDHCEGVE